MSLPLLIRKKTTQFLSILINIMDITSFAIRSFTYINMSNSDFSLYTWLYVFDSVDWLSQCMNIGAIGFGQIDISYNKFRTHFASLLPTTKSMYFGTLVDSTMQVCFLELQDITHPPRVKTHPLAEERSYMSYPTKVLTIVQTIIHCPFLVFYYSLNNMPMLFNWVTFIPT